MLVLVQLDISAANLALFEEYEAQALALLREHGGALLERLRSRHDDSEFHLLHFPDAGAFDAFRADPKRAGLQDLWMKCGASSHVVEVRRLSAV